MPMKYHSCIVYLICIITANGLNSTFANDPPSSGEQLRSELESALKIHDTNGVVSLFNSEGETNEWGESAGMREMMIQLQIRALLQTSNASVTLLPMPTNFPILQTNLQNGVCTKFNLIVIGMVGVKGQNNNVQQLPYGKNGNGFYIAGISQEKISGKQLSIRVLDGPNTDFLTYTGRWVYVKDGHEISVEISDKTNLFTPAWGDYIKSCEIRRTSMHEVAGFATWFNFQVVEGGATVFESSEMTNEDLFIYQRNSLQK